MTSTEGKNGIPHYGGEPSKLTEYMFRVRTRMARESTMDESELKKHGPLGLRLVEGLSGPALRVAQQMSAKTLATPKGPDELLENLQASFKPRRVQEARELYAAGAKEGGMLSRQPTEPMSTYLIRRRAWHAALVDLDSNLRLPEQILAEQVLSNSGISEHYQLLVRSALKGDMTVENVSQELIAQHARIHEKESRHSMKGRAHGHQRSWRDNRKGGHHGYMAEESYGNIPDDGADGYHQEYALHSEYDYNEPDVSAYDTASEYVTADEFDEGEALAMMAASGLDMEDEESMEYAAEVIQAEQEAFFARHRAHQKGIKGVSKGFSGRHQSRQDGGRQFDVSGQLSFSERQQRVQYLKSKTQCRRCGQTGHWSGDASCPKGKGKKSGGGKGSTASSSSSASKGGKDKARTVFFAVKDDVQENWHGYMAIRHNAVPPPRSLQDGVIVSSSDGDEWSLVEAERRMRVVDEGQAMSVDELDTAMLLSALADADLSEAFPVGGNLALPDLSLGASVAFADVGSHEAPTQASSVQESCSHENTTTKGSNAYYRMRRCLDCGKILEREKKDNPKMSSKPTPVSSSGNCEHNNVSFAGSNGHRWKKTCLDCGDVKSGPVSKKTGGVPSSIPNVKPQASSSSGYDADGEQGTTLFLGGSIPKDSLLHFLEMFSLSVRLKERLTEGAEVSIVDLVFMLRMSAGLAGADMGSQPEQPARKKMDHRDVPDQGHSQSPTSTSTAPGIPQHLVDSGRQLATFGKYKGQMFEVAWNDQGYVKWCLDNVNQGSSTGLKKLVDYFRQMRSQNVAPPAPRAYMATRPEGASENDLLAVLDTGCNATCHGSRWYQRYCASTGAEPSELTEIDGPGMRGIGGNMKIIGKRVIEISFELVNGDYARGTLTSLELEDSDAPMLLSIQTCSQLGFTIDVGNHVVESSVLGSRLKLVNRDGLMAIRVLPGFLGLFGDHQESVADEKRDEDHAVLCEDAVQQEEEAVNPEAPDMSFNEDGENLTPNAHLAADMLPNKKVFTRNQKKQFSKDVQEVKSVDRHMWNLLRPDRTKMRLLPRGCRTFLLEIFAGAAVLSLLAAGKGYAVSQPVDITYDGIDLKKESHRAMIEEQIERDDPYCIALSPVCGPWSPWQNVNMSKSESLEEHIMQMRKEWYPVCKWMCKIIRKRISAGRQVILEQPWKSAMWDSLAFQRLIQEQPKDALTGEPLEVVCTDQCRFGLYDRTNGLPHQKRTGILTASPGVKENLNYLCDGSHWHSPLEGGNKTRLAQEWPEAFCQAMLDGLCADLDDNITKVAFPAEFQMEESPFGTLDKIYNKSDEAVNFPGGRLDEHEIQQEEKRDEKEAVTEQEKVRKKEWQKLPFAQRVAVRRLHNMTGHASSSAMARMLRLAKVDPEVLHRMKHFRCETCQHLKKPEPRPVVRPPSQFAFNYELTADAFEVRDAMGNRYTVLSVICMGTLYHAPWIVSDHGGTPSSLRCAEAFRDGWFSVFGPPRFLTVDRGVANRGHLAALMSAQGVYIRYAGTEAAHQIGRAERQGSLLKEVIKHAVVARQVVGGQSMRMVVAESCFVKNCRINHGGFAPSQWVLGKLPTEITSLTSEEAAAALGVHEEIENGTSVFAQQMNIRQAAKEAFTEVDSSRRLRTAMLRKSTPLRGPYYAGDLLCFNRQGKWYGPARVVGREGRSNLWLIHGGIPIVINEENCRPAQAGEVLAKQLLELRPSRKRRREVLVDDAEEADVPFVDDLMMPLDEEGEDQGSYFQLGQSSGAVPVSQGADYRNDDYSPSIAPAEEVAAARPPPGLDAPADEELVRNEELERNDLNPAHVEMPQPPQQENQPDEWDEMEELLDDIRLRGDEDVERHRSVDEPDVEVPPAGTPRETTLTRALRSSVDGLDGISRRRERSRTPPRSTNFARMTKKQKAQSEVFNSFFARRHVVKKPQKRGGKELNYKYETEEKKRKIDNARVKEWSNWTNFDACDVIPPEKTQEFLAAHPGVQVVPMRWVDIDKAQEGEDEQLKSRIVVRGDLEKAAKVGDVRTDSPTASSLALHILLVFAACGNLTLHAGDITAAFLQGLGLARLLVMSLPADGVPGVAEGSLLVARKPVYGTKDAPRGFWRSLHLKMKAVGFRCVPHENAFYVMNNDKGGIDGLVLSHVDDLIWCGGERTQQAMNDVQKALKFGKVEDTIFKFCGRTISQDEDGIHVTCPHGLERTKPIYVSPERKQHRAAPVTEQEKSQMRSVIGSLNWVVRVNRPDLNYDVNKLQSLVSKPTVQDLLDCNGVLKRALATKDQKLTYPWGSFSFDQVQVLSITDASHAADFDVSQSGERLGLRSQSGRILALCGPDFIDKNEGHIYMLSWKSTVLRRVCRSTLQAESLSMLAGYEDAEHLRGVLHGLYHEHGPRNPNWQIQAQDAYVINKLTDCRSLSDHLMQQGLGEVHDKRLAIDISGMRQMVWRKKGEDIGDPLFAEKPPEDGTTKVLWISTKTMLADGLTKRMDCDPLRHVMNGNPYVVQRTFHVKNKTGVKTELFDDMKIDC